MLQIDIGAEELGSLRQIVMSDTPQGFIVFYTLCSGEELPAHCMDWIVDIYRARDELKKGFALEAFRGSLKTTIFTNWLAAYQLGCHPEKSGMFIQASDQSATDNAKFVASIIEHNPGWKVLFPNVVPDKSYGWGAQGYEVMRSDVPYGEWRKLRHKDPSLLGAGYKSSDIIGKHPNGFLFIDDMNDHLNTRSQRELRTCINILNKVIKPIPRPETWVGYIFTPWVPGDVGENAVYNPRLHHINYPIFKTETNADGKRVMTGEPVWPEVFPLEAIEAIKEENPYEFALMYLCDREAVKGKVLLREWLHYFPHDEIDDSWPVIIGVDYADIASEDNVKGRSYFALALFRVHPSGKLILCDGFRGHVKQSRAEDVCINWGTDNMENLLHFGIEDLGKGETFHAVMLKAAPFKVKGIKVGNQPKGEKYEKQMAPAFRRGSVWVSDESGNQFLRQFESEWLSFDELEQYTTDTLDAVYVALACGKKMLKKTALDEREKALNEYKESTRNPMQGFVRS